MTKIADAQFTALNLKTALAAGDIAAGDLIPVYDASVAAWKMVAIADLSTDTEVTTATTLLNVTTQTETILVAGAISVTKKITKLSAASGAYAVTLAAPDASMLGQVKTIAMSVAGNAITLALTNVVGGSAATSASFNAVDETLVLIAGVGKWTVIGEAGVTLS